MLENIKAIDEEATKQAATITENPRKTITNEWTMGEDVIVKPGIYDTTTLESINDNPGEAKPIGNFIIKEPTQGRIVWGNEKETEIYVQIPEALLIIPLEAAYYL